MCLPSVALVPCEAFCACNLLFWMQVWEQETYVRIVCKSLAELFRYYLFRAKETLKCCLAGNEGTTSCLTCIRIVWNFKVLQYKISSKGSQHLPPWLVTNFRYLIFWKYWVFSSPVVLQEVNSAELTRNNFYVVYGTF